MADGNFFGGQFFGGGFFGELVESAPTGIIGGGGYHPSQGYSGYETRRRTKKEIQEERERLGILPKAAEIIEKVAERQATEPDELTLDEQQRFEELQRELALESIEWDGKYLELLNTLREQLIRDEIAKLIRLKLQREENEMMVFMMAALA